MVIHAGFEATFPSAVVNQSNLAPKKYIVVKNHVREIAKYKENPKLEESDHEQVIEEKTKARKRKSNVTQDKKENADASKISKSDLEELRQVYFQCKNVLTKIETKYGCLLNLTAETHDNSEDLDSEDDECKCSHNKRIAFDDNGEQILKDPVLEKHICVKKLKHDGRNPPLERSNLKIELTDTLEGNIMMLPDGLQELGNILKQPDINSELRRNVINKIKGIRQDYINELRYDKKLLVEQLKANPSDDLFGFEGTNLSTITGYPA